MDTWSDWTYVALGWGAGVVVIGGYTVALLRRGRRLARRVPPDERRWM